MVVAEKATDFIAVMVLTIIGFYSFPYGKSVMWAGMIIIVLFLGILGYPNLLFLMLSPFEKIKLVAKLVRNIKEFYKGMNILIKPIPLLIATVLGLIVWFAECVAFYVVAKGFSLDFTIFQATFIYAFAILAGALTMIPGDLVDMRL